MPSESKPAGPFRGGSRYNPYGPFIRELFGCRVHKVVVDAGLTCPNRDGTIGFGGCIYCDNDAFRPGSADRRRSIRDQVECGTKYLRERYSAHKFIVYFQPFSNTHAPLVKLIPLYEEALSCKDVLGLSVGTRPDCIDEEKLAWFEKIASTHFVTMEYGLESIHDGTLARINRCHDYACWSDAVEQTRNRGIWLCTHLILGFPWESRDEMLNMAAALSNRGIDFLKIHHLHVVSHTPLGKMYCENPFPLMGYEAYRDLVVEFLERLDPSIRLERLFALAPEDRLLGPQWGMSKTEIQQDIEQELVRRNTYQGRLHSR